MERRIPIRRHLSERRKATKPGHVRAPQTRRRIGIRLSIAPLVQNKEGVAFAVTPRRNIKPINYIFVFIVYVCFLRVYRAFFIGGRAEN